MLVLVSHISAACFFRGRASRPAIVYCDPVGYEGAWFRQAACDRDVELIPVWSTPYAEMLSKRGDADAALSAQQGRAPLAGEEAAWAERELRGVTLVGVLCGSDAGLATAERLQHVLLPGRSNGLNEARRDKYLMHEALRSHGIAAAEQAVASRWDEAAAFMSRLAKPPRVVMKPRRGHAGLRVGLATGVEQARHMLGFLLAERVSLDREGASGEPTALLQEVLDGDEWVVDTVSRAGEHKAVALWRYRKGDANGAPFVNFCDELMPMVGETEEALVAYALECLEAVGFRWGPAHIEIKMSCRGPVLVEVNAGRFNGVRRSYPIPLTSHPAHTSSRSHPHPMHTSSRSHPIPLYPIPFIPHPAHIPSRSIPSRSYLIPLTSPPTLPRPTQIPGRLSASRRRVHRLQRVRCNARCVP